MEEGCERKLSIAEKLAGSCLAAMALISFVNVLGRYIFHYSLAFTEEVTIRLFVAMTVLGVGIAFEEGSHLGMVSLNRLMPTGMRRATAVGSAVLALLLFVAVDVTLLRAIHAEITIFHATSPALNIPVWIYDACVVALTPFVFVGIWRGMRKAVSECGQGED